MLLGGYSGTAGDGGKGLSFHNGHKFTTLDRDNDGVDGVCSDLNNGNIWGGFWFWDCGKVHLNSEYSHTEYFVNNNNRRYMEWRRWYDDRSLRKSELKFRPMQFP